MKNLTVFFLFSLDFQVFVLFSETEISMTPNVTFFVVVTRHFGNDLLHESRHDMSDRFKLSHVSLPTSD